MTIGRTAIVGSGNSLRIELVTGSEAHMSGGSRSESHEQASALARIDKMYQRSA